MNGKLASLLPPLIALALILTVWELAVRAAHVPAFILPGPGAISQSLASDLPALITSALITLRTAVIALAIASLIAVVLAAMAAYSRTAERILHPMAVAAQVTPVVAIAPLLLIWAGLEHPQRAMLALATIVAFFPLYSGTLNGLKSADPDLESLFRLYKASRWQRLTRLQAPAAVPSVIEGLRVATGLSLIGAVVAEFAAGSGAQQGLAWRILEAGNRLETARMFAALLVLAILGAILHALIGFAGARILHAWRGR